MNWGAIWLTAKLAAVTAALLVVIGMPLAYWLAFTRVRWKFLIEAVVALPLVLPPTVLGFYMLVMLGREGWIARWAGPLAFTFEGLVIASLFYSLPFAVQPFAAAFAGVDRRMLAASEVLGASRWRTFLRIIVPLSWNGILAGVVLSFAHTVGEFGVVLMVGGNIPGVTRTISIDIYDTVQELNLAAANQTATALLLFSFTVLSVVFALNRKLWVRQ
jgi:molybdate transport system permease protein